MRGKPENSATRHGRAPLEFGLACGPSDIEQIHALNYRTFVEEIPQHARNPERRRVDPFHAENTYIVCRCAGRIIGMLAVRARRPFSLDLKLPNLDAHLPMGRHICELRLLAVAPEWRNGRVFKGLTMAAAQYCLGRGYDLAIMSGTLRQTKLYRHLGFEPFGPLVGTGEAQFQPMYLSLERFQQTRPLFLAPLVDHHPAGPAASTPPGA